MCYKFLCFLRFAFHPLSNLLGLPMYAVRIGVVSIAGETPEVVAGVIYNPVS